MSDADYQSDRLITVERLLASLLVLLWTGLAAQVGGLPLGIRAFLLFLVPLAMIWFPQLLARLAVREDRWGTDFSPPPSAFIMRVIAWLVILGVPGAWFLFAQIGKG